MRRRVLPTPPPELVVGDWMLLDEAARYAGVSVDTLLTAIETEELAAKSMHPLRPGSWVVHSSALEAWAAAHDPDFPG